MEQNLERFMDLFVRFLEHRESSNTVDWSKLRPLPNEFVSYIANCLQYCTVLYLPTVPHR